jgi:hypothetical protein
MVEQWNGTTDFVFFARCGEMVSNRREDHYDPEGACVAALAGEADAARLRRTPLIWEHVNPLWAIRPRHERPAGIALTEMAAGDTSVESTPRSRRDSERMTRAFAKSLALALLFSRPSARGACVYEAAAWPDPSTTMSVASSAGATFTAALQQAAQTWDSDTVFAFTVFADAKADPCSDPNSSPPKNGVNFGTANLLPSALLTSVNRLLRLPVYRAGQAFGQAGELEMNLPPAPARSGCPAPAKGAWYPSAAVNRSVGWFLPRSGCPAAYHPTQNVIEPHSRHVDDAAGYPYTCCAAGD